MTKKLTNQLIGVTSGRNFRELGGYETMSGKKIKMHKLLRTGNLADCVALKMCEQCSDEVINQVMAEILQLRLEFVARISHTEKGSVRLFYKKLREEFTAQAEAISRKIIEA